MVRQAFIRSPRKSASRHPSELRMSDRSVRRLLKTLHFHPYKLSLVQDLNVIDKQSRLAFARSFLELKEQNPDICDCENPREVHQRPLHSPKVTVWCAISVNGIIGPYFFQNDEGLTVTVTAARYTHMLQTFLQPELARFHHPVWFQQDGATSHTARISMETLRRMFPGRLISRWGDLNWPPRSPDLAAPDYFLWGYLKNCVYQNCPATLDDLKENIRQEIQRIPHNMFQRVFQDLPKRLEECITEDGGHLLHTIFKS
ncbi:hypothetical protein C0J52_10549 [Blattella germanica]|nr:hypothetical protein C0J52_10549 [Blattella germanica]